MMIHLILVHTILLRNAPLRVRNTSINGDLFDDGYTSINGDIFDNVHFVINLILETY
jgi:hypothetical protein